MGWGNDHGHRHDPRVDAIKAAQKMATAIHDYLRAPTSNHREHLAETVAVFDREMGRVQ